ncbi:zinc finger MYM-type protein 6-like [Patiria miniata]|uniref:HECT domain-containing protein n=1 Tax=Patiria miniata TaxID=46514 RepID=A0A914A5A5_PATMI|nr:zinc finger MYM-type protein 6-like [Patiria miniata]
MASTSKKDIKRKQLYKKEYTEKWDFIQPSQRGENYARCTLCISDFSIGHSGSYDITQHIETTKHRNIAETKSANRSIRQFMPSNKDYDLIRAETLWTEYVIEHNMPFVSSDEFTDVVKQMFPDSKIASKFSCRRTKTTAIARTLGQQTKDDITHRLRQTRFSLSTEGSSDRGAEEQLYPIVVRYFDENVNRVVGVLLEIATTEKRSTGANIFELLDNALKEKRIPWENCICFSADNASVMMGIHAGVATYVRKQNPDVFVLGCPCHRLHLAAEKGASTLPFTPVDVLIAVFYYLEKSSKRHKELKGVQTLCGTANHKILKHVCTRWLSLEKALNRLLEQWPALLEYFKREAGHGSEKRKNEESSNQPKKQKSNQTKDSESSAAGTSTGRTTTGVHTSSQTKDSESSPAGTSTGVHTSSQTKDSESSPAGTSTGVHTSSRTKDSESSPAGTSTGRTTTGVHTSKSCSGFARAIGAYTRRKLPQIWLPRVVLQHLRRKVHHPKAVGLVMLVRLLPGRKVKFKSEARKQFTLKIGQLGQFLQFLTGKKTLPPLGFKAPPSIKFRHPEDVPNGDHTRDFPKVCACFHVLTLPTGHRTTLELLKVLTNTVSICSDLFTDA